MTLSPSLVFRALTCSLSCGVLPAQAEIVERIDYRYYAVDATADRPLYAALDAASPIRQNGRVFHGFTRWELNWRYRWDARGDGRCRITQISVKLDATVDLPQLRSGTDRQGTAFATYLKALREHELGHVQIGREAAQAVERRISILPEMASCATLEQTANQTGYRTLAEFGDRDRQYDLTTGHGKTQGAWLSQ